eukprot:1234146-Alexandrium_andersonii.AAC.1
MDTVERAKLAQVAVRVLSQQRAAPPASALRGDPPSRPPYGVLGEPGHRHRQVVLTVPGLHAVPPPSGPAAAAEHPGGRPALGGAPVDG